jgi:uncharacterized protein (DUF952 family)/heme-degrading monooxygenase HmoA
MTSDPYVAVIFTSRRTDDDEVGYLAMADHMETAARSRPGYLGIESVRSPDGGGITVSYWVDDAAARAWKADAEHLAAQRSGRDVWYDEYTVRVAHVEREYAYIRPIFHMAMPDDWRSAQDAAVYSMSTRGITVEQEGFVHCSFAHQMRGVANRFYADVDELVILHLDRRALADHLRIEAAADGVTERFPHIYSAIPLSAVTATTPWRREAHGWDDPPV